MVKDLESDYKPLEYDDEEERTISAEERWELLVQNNIITKKTKEKKEPNPEVDNLVKVSSYLLEKHKSYFNLFSGNGAHYEAVILTRRLIKDGVIDNYSFKKEDTSTMKCIDDAIEKYYPSGFIPTEHPFIKNQKN